MYVCHLERAASLPELTPAQKNKLRHLSIISLASNLKVVIHLFSDWWFISTVFNEFRYDQHTAVNNMGY